MNRQILLFEFAFCFPLATFVGCNENALPLVPVAGRVTFEGGSPPTAGTITFTPINVEQDIPKRPGRAKFNVEGYYQVTSFQENDGLLPGQYQVNIACWQGNPTSSDPSSFERLNLVPKDYHPSDLFVEKNSPKVLANYDIPPK